MKLLIPVFSPPSGTWGSLTRVMAIAKKFKNEGHSVAFCASRFVKEALREKGYQAYELPETTMFGLPKFISNIISKKSQKMTPPAREGKSLGNIWALFLLAGYGKKKIFKKMIEAEINAVNAFDPDVILTEMELAAYLTANILNKPIVTTYAHISLKGKDTFFYKIMKRTINSILRKYKKEEAEDLYKIAFGKNVLKLIPSIPELDTTNPDREDICYTGNLLEPIKNTKNKFIPEKGKKYIFCYFGTGSVSFSTIEKVLPIVVNKMENTVCYVASQSIRGYPGNR